MGWFGGQSRGSTHVIEKFSFSMFPSILTIILTQFWGNFGLFGALRIYFWGWGRVQKLFLGSTHVVEQLPFCMFLSIMIFVLLNFGVIFYFLGP